MNKYLNHKTVLDGFKFDSRKESERYAELRLLEKGGLISGLKMQPEFVLIEGFVHKGKKIRATKYIADFLYFDESSRAHVVEDVKSSYLAKKNELYKLKKKLFLKKFPEFDFRELLV